MQRTFTFDAARREAIWSSMLCVGSALLGASYLALGDFPRSVAYGSIIVSVLFALFSALFARWSRNDYLTIDGNRLTVQEAGRARTVDLATVTKAKWDMVGGITLYGPEGEFPLRLRSLVPADRLTVVEFLREALPDQIQEKWEPHGLEHGLYLRQSIQQDVGRLRAGPKNSLLDPSHEWEVRGRIAAGDVSAAHMWQARDMTYAIADGVVIQRAGDQTLSIRLADVLRADWKTFKLGKDAPVRGRLTLTTSDAQMEIYFRAMDVGERLQLIRRLRYGIPRRLQHGWRPFCRKIAYPLQAMESPDRPLAPHEARRTRRGVDCTFFCAYILCFCAVAWFIFSNGLWPFLPRPPLLILLGIAVMLLLWLIIRFSISLRGEIVHRTPCFLWIVLAWVAFGAITFAIFPSLVSLVVWFAGFWILARAFDRRNRRLRCDRNRYTIHQWDEVEKWLAREHRMT